MIVHLVPTSKLLTVDGVTARVWEGTTEGGVTVSALIVRIAVEQDANTVEFDDLAQCAPPSVHVDAWPNRLVL